MPDPTVTSLTTGSSTTAATTVSFSAQAAGTLLLLAYAGDDYYTLSGSNRPESSGWTLAAGQRTGFHGSALWYKIASGSETSVAYTIGSATKSVYLLTSATNIDGASTVDGTPAAQVQNTSTTSYTTPSGSTSAGRRLGVAILAACNGTTTLSAPGTFTNSYVSVNTATVASTASQSIGMATLTFDGGATTSSGATWPGATPESKSGIIAVFKVASSAPAIPPILLMPPLRR